MRFAWTSTFAGSIAIAVVWAAACGGSDGSSTFPPIPPDDTPVDGGSAPPLSNDGGLSDTSAPYQALVVTPADTTLDVTGPGATRQFTAMLKGYTQALTATWSVDLPRVGSIDGSGQFTASGVVGGVVTIGAQTADGRGTTTLTVHANATENPGGVDPGTQGQLRGGGSADLKFRWLYPYDKTVFPRGLVSPTLQWDGEAATAVLVHVTSKTMTYDGYYAGSNPSRVDLTATAWSLVTDGAAPGDPVTVQVTKKSASGITGPIQETWTIAPGSLKGTVYYNTYDSPANDGSGAVMRIKPGKDAEIMFGGCTVCHAVSADGSTMVALGTQEPRNADAGRTDSYYYKWSTSWDLTSDAGVLKYENTSDFGFGAMSPDGKLLLSCASLPNPTFSDGGIVWPHDWSPNIPGLGSLTTPVGDRAAQLFDTKTGALVPSTGIPAHALMPAFSPSGRKVVFNHYDKGKGHSLAVMDFDPASHAFSNLVDVVTTNDANTWFGWPYFTPDSASVVYNTVNWGDYATWDNLKRNTDQKGNKGDLQLVDVASKAVTPLDAINGISGNGVYLPYGADEAHMNYEPTTLPVAVGGYYWVVFTSRRDYGNTITVADPYQPTPAIRKKLWVAAIDIGAKPGADPSHPAFYLSGQEPGAGNMRGFWALDPCKQQGTSCDSGDECCTGFCRQSSAPDGGVTLACVPQPVGCAQEFEKCATAGDCCGAPQGYQCLNGHCARPAVK